jgi:hypothetical protein
VTSDNEDDDVVRLAFPRPASWALLDELPVVLVLADRPGIGVQVSAIYGCATASPRERRPVSSTGSAIAAGCGT